MKKLSSRQRLALEILGLMLLTGLTFWVLLRQQDLGRILDIARSANPWWLLAAVGAALGHVFFNGLAIPVLFSAMGRRVTILQSLRYSLIEFFFSSVTPANSGGQPAQALALVRDGHSASTTALGLLMLAMLYKLSLVVLFLLALVTDLRFMLSQIRLIPIIFTLGFLLTGGIVVLTNLLLFRPALVNGLLRLLLRLMRKLPFVKDPEGKYETLREHAEEYHECALFMKTHKRAMAQTFAVSLAQRVCILLVACFVFLALGAPAMVLRRVWELQLLIAVSVDMLPLPGGVGAAEAVSLQLYEGALGPLLMFPAMLLWRGVSYYLILAVSGAAVLAFRLLARRGRKTG